MYHVSSFLFQPIEDHDIKLAHYLNLEASAGYQLERIVTSELNENKYLVVITKWEEESV